MKSNKLFIGMLLGLLLGSRLSHAFERIETVTTKAGEKLDFVSRCLIHSNFKTLAKLSGLLVIIKLIYDLTDGKNFNEVSNDENMKRALKSFTEKFGSLDATKQAVKELWYKVIRMLRAITGHRPYKISVQEETEDLADGSKLTKKQEKTVPGTKLCKSIEMFLETMYPFIITSSTAVLGFRKLAHIIEAGNFLEEAPNLPEIKTKAK